MLMFEGEIVPEDAQLIVILALADLDGSAMLVAVTLTAGGEGRAAGAV